MMRVVTTHPIVAGTEPVLTSAKIDALVGRVVTTILALPVIHPDGPDMGKN